MKKIKFSILIPVYKGVPIISETIQSILNQTYSNFEILVQDNNSHDNIRKLLKKINDKRIHFYQNKKNLGYPGNLEKLRKKARGEIIFLMAHDDILDKKALEQTYKAFCISKDIGAVTRPYYWFDERFDKPVRAKKQLNKNKDEIITMKSDYSKLMEVISSIDQLSGLAMKRELIELPFHKDIFSCHAYPFASILKKHPIVFLKNYTVAVRIATSMTRYDPTIYFKSPLQSDIDFFNTVFFEKKFKKFRNYMIENFVGKEHISLIQLKTYSSFKYLLREIYILVKCRWKNIFSLPFWFFVLVSFITPKGILRFSADWFKKNIMSQKLKYLSIEK